MTERPARETAISYESWGRLLAQERLPVGLVDLDAFDRNVEQLAEIARRHGKNLRIATKSIRVPELIQRVLAKGAPFRGLMCYAAEEVKLLAQLGLDDFLIAYPTVQASDLAILWTLHAEGKSVTLVIDSREHLAQIAAVFKSVAGSSDAPGAARPFPLMVEWDCAYRPLGSLVHIGVRRSGVRTVDQCLALVQAFKDFPEFKFQGVMAYEAQVAGLGDRNPFKKILNPIAQLIRKLSLASVAHGRARLAEELRAHGYPAEIFNGGGSGSLNFAANESALTEITAGSGLLGSHLFDYYSNIAFEPAVFFALQVVRSSDPGYVTCQGGGYVSSGEPGWDKVPRPYLPAGLSLVSTEGTGEVQTPLRLAAGVRLPIGSPVIFRPSKAGEPAERFTEYLLVQGGRVVSRAKTYRGMGACFF